MERAGTGTVEDRIERAISTLREIEEDLRSVVPPARSSSTQTDSRLGAPRVDTSGGEPSRGDPHDKEVRERIRRVIREVLDSNGLLDDAKKKLLREGLPRDLVIEEIVRATWDIVETNALRIGENNVPVFVEVEVPTEEEEKKIEIISGGRFGAVKKRIKSALSGGVGALAREIDETKWFLTGIPGVDSLFHNGGIPRGSAVLLIGGPGSGKTIFTLQSMYRAAERGERVLYITLEEEPDRLLEHMRDFGWNPDRFIGSSIRMIRLSPFDISRSVEALLEKEKGDLEIDVKPIMIDEDYNPTVVYIDSISAIASAFSGEEKSYRVYIDQLFRMLREIGVTSILVSETEDTQKKLTPSGVEEFLADGVLIIHTIRKGDRKLRGFEIYKMRGTGFEERIVAMRITPSEGVSVYPDEKVYGL